MDDNMKRKHELELAMRKYLSQAEMHPMSESWDLAHTGNFVLVFGRAPFYAEDDPESYCFLAPQAAERKLMEKVDSIFDSLIRPATVRSSLQRPLSLAGQDAEFIFPFETKEQEQQYHDKIYELLNFHYERRYEAIVPMYQLNCDDGVEFPLANAVLYSGGQRSLLASLVSFQDSRFIESVKNRIEYCSYLKFPVTGDTASCLKQVEYEAERALQVLRFIYPWFENYGKAFNPAHGVSMWKHSPRIIFYDYISKTNEPVPWQLEAPNGMLGARRITSELLNDAKKYYYLDSINYHFRNHDHNLLSRRFCRAFNFYDIASRTSDDYIALTNFTICVDILLPSGKRRELRDYLISLIEMGDLYVGKMTLDQQLSDPGKTEWPERVRLTVSDYKAFYLIRNKVVHGNTMTSIISDMQVKKARQIAHNAIRAYAKLSRAFNWQSDKEAKQWFKQPCKPPEMKTP